MTFRVVLIAIAFAVLTLLPLLLLGGCAPATAKVPTLGKVDTATVAWMEAHGYTW